MPIADGTGAAAAVCQTQHVPAANSSPTTRRVVVTGASAGAGRAIALRFGAAGCRVGLLARDPDRLHALRQEIEAAGGEALVLPTDVADARAVDAARDRVMEAWHGIDIWINCAMVTVVAPIAQMKAAEYRRVTEVTYLGCVHGTLAALEAMRPVDRGLIIQVGSALAYRAIPLQSAYCAAKFAVRGFTDSLRTELRHARSGIRVSMLQMPAMNTPQFEWARNKLGRKLKPVGHIYSPEVAADAVFRAADGGSRELWVGASAVQAIIGQMVAPRFLDRLLARKGWDGQLDKAPEEQGRADNLFDTVPGEFGARGRFSARSDGRALLFDPNHGRIGLLLAMATVALALAALTRRSR